MSSMPKTHLSNWRITVTFSERARSTRACLRSAGGFLLFQLIQPSVEPARDVGPLVCRIASSRRYEATGPQIARGSTHPRRSNCCRHRQIVRETQGEGEMTESIRRSRPFGFDFILESPELRLQIPIGSIDPLHQLGVFLDRVVDDDLHDCLRTLSRFQILYQHLFRLY